MTPLSVPRLGVRIPLLGGGGTAYGLGELGPKEGVEKFGVPGFEPKPGDARYGELLAEMGGVPVNVE